MMALENSIGANGMLNAAFGTAASGGVQPTRHESDAPQTSKPKPVYVSLRVTAEEKARLKKDAAGLSLSDYVRGQLLGDEATPRRTRGKFPVEDHAALSKVLRALGQSGLAADFETLSWAERDGTLVLDAESNQALRQACADVAAIRRDLIKALGLQARSP
ncbi:MAG: hypothetical protein AAF683_01295 [Pseudomonadota bacterium]